MYKYGKKYFGCVYKATNTINMKCYIGQTSVSLHDRRRKHISESNKLEVTTAFCNAIRKYGKDNFVWEVLEYCESKDELNLAEEWYIRYYKTFTGFSDNRGYNLTLGGEGVVGYSPSKKTLENLSKSHIGIKMPPFTERHKNKISNALKGKELSEQHKINVSKGRKGICVGEDNHAAKKYVITFPNGEEFVVYGLLNFCNKYKKYKLDVRNLSACAVGKRNHHIGHKCRYYNSKKDRNISYWVNN